MKFGAPRPIPGQPGKSAYDLATAAGFVGTVEEWLAAQKGEPGPQGTATPGTYTAPEGHYVTGFTIAEDGAVTLHTAPLATSLPSIADQASASSTGKGTKKP